MKPRSSTAFRLLVATLLGGLLVASMFSFLLVVYLMRCWSWVGSVLEGTLPSSRAAHLYMTGPGGFPTQQPSACTPPDTCQLTSTAPPCCTRGHGASSVCSTPPPLSSRASGSEAASKTTVAPLRRLRYNRYAGAAQAEARDQALPSSCLMRESLIGWDVVATHMCPLQMVNPSCSRKDCDDQVGCITAHWCNIQGLHSCYCTTV